MLQVQLFQSENSDFFVLKNKNSSRPIFAITIEVRIQSIEKIIIVHTVAIVTVQLISGVNGPLV